MLVNILFGTTFISVMILSAVVGYYYGVRVTIEYYNTLIKQVTAKSTQRFEADFNDVASKRTH